MHFDDNFISLVKDRNPLFEVISDYVPLKRQGQLWVAHCPFHAGDSNPSFKYYPKDQGAHCYGCGTNIGDSIDFIMKIENLQFPEAVEFLAERANIPLPENNDSDSSRQIRMFRENLENKSREFWINLMTKKENQHIKNYLLQRGLTEEDITKWRIGYCDFTYANRYKENNNDDDARRFKKFTNRIIFSVLDHRNQIVGFSGRRLPDQDDKFVKYLNSSDKDNPLFKKNEIVYGLNYAKKAIADLGFVIWVEGFFDVILMHQIGIENTVASMGTAITPEQIKLVKKFTNNVILFLDPDEAGQEAMKKSLELFSAENIEVKIIQGINGLDPAETVKKLGNNFKDWLYYNAKTIEQYYVDKFLARYNNQVNMAKKDMINNLKSIFANRLDHIETDIALGAICNAINVDINILKNIIAKN